MALFVSELLAFAFKLHTRKVRLTWLDRLKPLGDMSYTLYVTHFPILVRPRLVDEPFRKGLAAATFRLGVCRHHHHGADRLHAALCGGALIPQSRRPRPKVSNARKLTGE
ncbi:MAG: hypothetical protein EXS33_08005 [Pedosphaera sp.]|nr:hypothetical protein [Pedosphaera sp.]